MVGNIKYPDRTADWKCVLTWHRYKMCVRRLKSLKCFDVIPLARRKVLLVDGGMSESVGRLLNNGAADHQREEYTGFYFFSGRP